MTCFTLQYLTVEVEMGILLCAVTQILTKMHKTGFLLLTLTNVLAPLFSHSFPDDDACTCLKTLDE